MSIRCFFIEPTAVEARSLRRFSWYVSGAACHHDASTPLDRVVPGNPLHAAGGQVLGHGDARWPSVCRCGYEFQATDEYQVFTETIYRRADTGEETTLRSAPIGAMWYADWQLVDGKATPYCHPGPDGHVLVVRLPPDGHDWIIDSRANNCTMPNDNAHACWVRHGQVPSVTVDKGRPGESCAAGGGSILTPKWHGFLRNGELVP